ncbi:beta/alpha barrel domain-containing protein [Sphingobacterium paludis]|uniref:Hydroxymethylglutaryl-CoA lyase n=1 Tax=Sphingobacterium paludis TaxID=1476465 RepID=A0A4R7D561_9SPHI|nr:hydroxymethylglutaryl-CoA lyase [Sphingobacterium paludis]TDS14845.1 hydroxymethylglutaryl-CoA lyase [Sphingobacterium paludis]
MSKQTNAIAIVDCPRDAIQGIPSFIPTDKKISYLNGLLQSGWFDFLDFGSFVSPTAVPQLADTLAVWDGLDKTTKTKFIAIIANEKGAEIGSSLEGLDYLGYPFSVSDTFQQRNTNRSTAAAFESVLSSKDILMQKNGPELMIYISMAFGNPYGDLWHPEIVLDWMEKLIGIGIRKFSIADTTSQASAGDVKRLLLQIGESFPDIALSIHLHSRSETALAKVNAAFDAGCRTFEGAIMGYGGCPFAQDDLVGNIPSELLLKRFSAIHDTQVIRMMENFQRLIARDV